MLDIAREAATKINPLEKCATKGCFSADFLIGAQLRLVVKINLVHLVDDPIEMLYEIKRVLKLVSVLTLLILGDPPWVLSKMKIARR